MKLSIVATIAALALSLPALAQQPTKPVNPGSPVPPAQAGTLQTKSYQPIGKNKLQVDLSVANAGELQRDLHDYFKERLQARGNAVGSSGTLAVKLAIEYVTPAPSLVGTDANPPPPPPGVGAGTATSQESPIPDSKAPAFKPTTPAPNGLSPMHLTITVYREQGGAVAWTGEATCNTPFKSAKLTGKAMIDQLVESIDTTRTRDADCPL